MAEPGSSSEEWKHRGKVFVCLARLMPGGGDSAGLRDQWPQRVVKHMTATTRLGKVV